jgi:HAD superfamily hydrolase (TIGR01509 family)
MFDAYILDCDGVLFDSLQANIEFYNALLRAFGRSPLDDTQMAYIHMATAEESVAYLFRGDPHLEEAQKLRTTMDYHRFIPYMKLAPGAREVLEILKKRGKRLAICTNRSVSMRAVLEYFGLSKLFDCVVTTLEVKRPKPDPEGLRLILDTLNLTPISALFIGDSVLDQQAAKAAGIPFAGYRSPDLEAEYSIESFWEILSLQPNMKGVSHAHVRRD